jgi:hypothetical protein
MPTDTRHDPLAMIIRVTIITVMAMRVTVIMVTAMRPPISTGPSLSA